MELIGWLFLLPSNEVWGKVICLQVCVCPQGVPGPGGRGCLVLEGVGTWSWGYLVLGAVWSWGLCLVLGVPGGFLVLGGVPGPGGYLVETPPGGYCCGRCASYWNTFLFCIFSFPFVLHNACIPIVEPCLWFFRCLLSVASYLQLLKSHFQTVPSWARMWALSSDFLK